MVMQNYAELLQTLRVTLVTSCYSCFDFGAGQALQGLLRPNELLEATADFTVPLAKE